MLHKLTPTLLLLWISILGLAQIESQTSETQKIDNRPASQLGATLNFSETGPIDACDVRELGLFAEIDGYGVERVQFDYSADGRNWQNAGTDTDGRDGFSAKMGVTSLPDGTYKVQATAFFRGDRTVTANGSITVYNAIAAPYWSSPSDLESRVSKNSTLLEVTQDPNTSNWVSVTYSHSMDGINFTEIATISKGAETWGHQWDLSKTEPSAFIVRATVTDISGNKVNTFRRMSRIYESDFFADVKQGPIMLKSFEPGEMKVKPEFEMPEGETNAEPVLLVDSLKGTLNYQIDTADLMNTPVGMMRAKLFLDPMNDDTMFATEVEIAPGQNPSFNVDGLPAGGYRAMVLLNFNSNTGAHTVRSPSNNITAFSDTGTDFGDPNWATGVLDGLIGKTGSNGSASFSLKRDGVNVEAISHTDTNAGVKASVVGSGFARLEQGTYLSFLVTNTSETQLEDDLRFQAYSWTTFGDPVMNDEQTFAINLSPGESTNIQLVTPGSYGQVEQFSGFIAEMVKDTAGVTGFGYTGMNDGNKILEKISLEIGDDQVAFEPFETKLDYSVKPGYPEYHWVKCDKVPMGLEPGYDPAASYSTTIVNRPGRTITLKKKCPTLHAGIIGGPHSLRTTCISRDGKTKVYGSEHYVHKGIRRITLKPKPTTGGKRAKNEGSSNEIIPTLEYECGATIIGVSGPGGSIKHTTGFEVSVNVSVTSTLSGSIGKEGVAQIGASVGVTAGASVTLSATNEYSKDLEDGKCGILKQRLCFKVWRGEIEVEFTDGTIVKGDFEAKKLDSVGYKVIPADCP